MASYSLGKASLEHTIKLLAPELAQKDVTINVLCPSFIPTGINKHADERRCKIEASRIPMGRLCAPSDIIGAVRYFLSRESSFVSGQVLEISGGQL
jgi:3-oxoacyl-[acyl-carrier protein] reductase